MIHWKKWIQHLCSNKFYTLKYKSWKIKVVKINKFSKRRDFLFFLTKKYSKFRRKFNLRPSKHIYILTYFSILMINILYDFVYNNCVLVIITHRFQCTWIILKHFWNWKYEFYYSFETIYYQVVLCVRNLLLKALKFNSAAKLNIWFTFCNDSCAFFWILDIIRFFDWLKFDWIIFKLLRIYL